jgi:hypothetical protein
MKAPAARIPLLKPGVDLVVDRITGSALQIAYQAHRRAVPAEVHHWLATRELPGSPPPIQPELT